MIKYCYIFFSICLISCQIFNKRSKNAALEMNAFVIKPYYGIDSVFIGESVGKDIIAVFGKAKVQRKWRPNNYPVAIGEVIKIIEYPDLGIRFILDHGKGRFSRKTLREITVDSTSKIQTPLGNGIGSTYSNIKSEFGETKFSRGTFPTFKLTHLSYDLENEFKHSVMMHFCQYGIVDSSTFKVEMIWITYQ
ncbi:MAG: hypothetical protein JWO44_651 [Bacteroidetes bacterium]|nr:hypothetical protein [Bacteroidota bacterium]